MGAYLRRRRFIGKGECQVQFRRLGRVACATWVIGAALPVCAAAPTPDATVVQELVVTAQKLNAARASIQPQIGASVYTIDSTAIAAMPGGDNAGLSQVILQSPGVAQDSFGQLHVRGEHNGLQFRLNGAILPEGLSVFSQALNPRLADKVALITGALPAQYGLRTAGIIDITTKSGVYKTGGEVAAYGGSHGQFEPSFQLSGSVGELNAFVSASYLRNNLGIESPTSGSAALHDRTQQFQGFAYLEDILDPQTRISLIAGTSHQRFQIPNQSGLLPSLQFGPAANQPLVVNGRSSFDSATLNESQREITHYAVASWLHTTQRLTAQISVHARYSSLQFNPDHLGDLLFTGIAQNAFKQDVASGLQAEGVYDLGAGHTLRAGGLIQIDRAISRTRAQVIGLDATGAQISDLPVTIIDDGAHTAKTFSAYLQDEWKLRDNLTVNYGARFDQFDGARHEHQLSPRFNLVWLPLSSTTIHAGYSRYFSPPPFELVAATSVAKFASTTGAATCPATVLICASQTPYAERANYFDVGVSQKLIRGLTLGIDSYAKFSTHLIDEGQFGAPIILTPFNYQDGRQYGLELTAAFNRGPLSSYANFAYERNKGRQIISSQFNFDPADLGYIATHFIYLDHDQTYTASAGASYLWRGTRAGGDLTVGSGLRSTGLDGVPNGAHLPSYAQLNLAISHSFETSGGGAVDVRLDVINALDHGYEIRNGSGIGVGAPQFGARRGIFAGVTRTF